MRVLPNAKLRCSGGGPAPAPRSCAPCCQATRRRGAYNVAPALPGSCSWPGARLEDGSVAAGLPPYLPAHLPHHPPQWAACTPRRGPRSTRAPRWRLTSRSSPRTTRRRGWVPAAPRPSCRASGGSLCRPASARACRLCVKPVLLAATAVQFSPCPGPQRAAAAAAGPPCLGLGPARPRMHAWARPPSAHARLPHTPWPPTLPSLPPLHADPAGRHRGVAAPRRRHGRQPLHRVQAAQGGRQGRQVGHPLLHERQPEQQGQWAGGPRAGEGGGGVGSGCERGDAHRWWGLWMRLLLHTTPHAVQHPPA